jgi:hypothetical protein
MPANLPPVRDLADRANNAKQPAFFEMKTRTLTGGDFDAIGFVGFDGGPYDTACWIG